MKTVLFNPRNIRNIEINYSMTEKTELFSLKYKKGEVVRKGVRIFGMTLIKPKIATENLYKAWSIRRSEILGWGDIKKEYDRYEIGSDGEIYLKPNIEIWFTDGTKKTKFFESDREMAMFFDEEINKKVKDFIRDSI